MNNVIAHPATIRADRAIAELEEYMPHVAPPRTVTALQLRRRLATYKKHIKREQALLSLKSQIASAQSELSELMRQNATSR